MGWNKRYNLRNPQDLLEVEKLPKDKIAPEPITSQRCNLVAILEP